jgi:hypothetical protein
MAEVNSALIFLILGTGFFLGLYFYFRRIWIGVILVGAYFFRILFGALFQGDIQYNFVLDSLGYEYRAWLLAQKWMTIDIFGSLNKGYMPDYNYYEMFLAWFFSIFGRDLFLAKMANAFFGTLTIFFIYRIQVDFFTDRTSEKSRVHMPAIVTAMLLTFYPSFVVWSASNIRDPLYFLSTVAFFYFFFRAVSTRVATGPVGRVACLAICLFCYWMVMGLRSYVAPLFIASLIFGTLASVFSKRVSAGRIALASVFLVIAFCYAYQMAMPADTSAILKQLQITRVSFGNLNLLDSVAKSSFGLDQEFKSVTDVLKFVPISLSHYFFGPFPWEVVDTMQALSLFEAFAVYLLIYCAFLGIRIVYRRRRFETIVLLTFVIIFVSAQSLVISNMGTIFRHRTLTFLFLSIFAGEGLSEVLKHRFPVGWALWRVRFSQ